MSGSDRRSDRVGQTTPGATEIPSLERNSAPESMPVPRVIPGRPAGAPERSRRRVSRNEREVIQRGLSDREWSILQDLDSFRFLTSRQIQQLHFSHINTPTAAARICGRVLKRLHSYRVVDHLERRIGGVRAGSASYVWVVGHVGERLLRANDDVRIRRKEPSLHFMQHCLAIADCTIRLRAAAAQGAFDLQTIQTEPTCWRRYMTRSGTTETLKPDLRVVTAQGEFEDSWFIEIDRGTESMATLIRQCRQYLTYRQTGQEQADLGIFPAVVWVLPDERRIARLQGALAAARSLDTSIFRLTTPDLVAEVVSAGAA